MATDQPTWFFLSNHANVLLTVAQDSEARTRDIAERVGVTERAAQRILGDLIAEGYVSKIKVGRRNRYTVHRHGHLRHPRFREFEIGPLLDLLHDGGAPGGDGASAPTKKALSPGPVESPTSD
jgi:predicted ArsR family transcriptional regulator